MAQPEFAPPPKKMRFEDGPSPRPASPYAPSPTTPYIQLPGATSPYPFNSPQPVYPPQEMPPPAGTPGGIMGPPMGPPARPSERQQQQERQAREQMTDMNTITDVLFGTGLDLRAEEAMMQSSYFAQHSFQSQSTNTLTPGDSFGLPSFGPLSSQDPASQESVENELVRKHEAIARQFAERKQAPLYDPFLQMNVVRTKLQRRVFENHVQLHLDGLYVKTEEQRPGADDQRRDIQVRSAIGQDGVGIVAATGPGSSSWVQANAQLVEIFSLLSLAANDRLRNITEDAYALARGRQAGSDGIVDPDWESLAVGSGKASPARAIPLSVSRTAWDMPGSGPSSTVVPAKRKSPGAAESLTNGHRLPTPPTEPSPTPKPTKRFSNELADTLRDLAKQERDAEKARLDAREKRKKAAASAAAAASSGTPADGADGSPATPGSATPATPAIQVAPDISKISKKEAMSLKKAARNTSEDVMRANANTTASMALGGGRKFSWMKSGPQTPKPAAGRFGTPAASAAGAATGIAAAPAPPQTQAGLRARDQKFGEWKEGGKMGGGIQLRDLSHVLERDGKAKKSLARVLARQSSSDKPGEREYARPAPIGAREASKLPVWLQVLRYGKRVQELSAEK